MSLQNTIVIKNKKASFDYEFIETFVAGIVLTGTEIKSIRLGKASLVDSYCVVIRNELWVKNMYIAEYFLWHLQQPRSTKRPEAAAQPEGIEENRPPFQ